MAEIDITASQWRFVEVGRVVLFTHGIYLGRLAAIVEIIDHKRVRSILYSCLQKPSINASHRFSSMGPQRKNQHPSPANPLPSTI